MRFYDDQIKLSLLVGTDFRAACLLDIFKLDFSSNEDKSLETAAMEAGASPEDIVAALNRYLREDFFPESSVQSITSNIVTIHHGFLWKTLPRIEKLFQHIALEDKLEEAKRLFFKVAENIRNHSREEEQRFFPALIELESRESQKEAISIETEKLKETMVEMENEHSSCAMAFERLGLLTSGYAWNRSDKADYRLLMQQLRILDFDLKLHIYKENNLLHSKLKQITQSIEVPVND